MNWNDLEKIVSGKKAQICKWFAAPSQPKSGDSNEFELKGAAGVVTKCGGGGIGG